MADPLSGGGAFSSLSARCFFFRQALLNRLGGDLERDGADLELVVTEDVGIVRGGEVGSEFADLGVDGLTDGSGEVIDFSLLFGR